MDARDNEITQARVNAWLTVHDPAHYTGRFGIHTPEVMDTFAAMATAADSPTAPAQSALTGPGASDALKADVATFAVLKGGASPTDPAFVDQFKKDLVGGAVTLSEMARNAAGYQPQVLDNSGANAAAYEAYLQKIGSCPLFILRMSDRLTINRTTSNWDTLIDAIADTFAGIQAEDKDAIVKGLKTLASAASTKMSTTETESVFVQNALNVDGVVSLYLYNSQVTFREESGKGFDTKQNTFDVVRLKLEFQSALWPNYAAAVAAKFTSSVDDWLTNNATSTAGTKPIVALQT